MLPESTDEYLVFDEIARGGMATVHVGLKRAGVGFQRTVALKCLPAEPEGDTTRIDMMVDEARLASRIAHPNVVPVLDVVVRDGSLTLVMPLVRGVSLARLLERMEGAPCPPEIAVAIATDVLAGLEAAHALRSGAQSLGVIHRDVSPSNVIVSAEGVASLLDFGIAKSSARHHVTTQQERKGKLGYMAPEQLEGNVDHRVDVYALSVLLWEMLVGRTLFPGGTPGEIVQAVLALPVPRPSRVRAGLPRALDAVVLRGLERDRAQRWPSAREMRLALEAASPRAAPTELEAWVTALGAAELASLDAAVARAESAPTPPAAALDSPEQPPTTPAVARVEVAQDTRPLRKREPFVAQVVLLLMGMTAAIAGAVAIGSWSVGATTATEQASASVHPLAAAPSPPSPMPSLSPSPADTALSKAEEAPTPTHTPRLATAARPIPRPKSAPIGAASTTCEVRTWIDATGKKRYGEVCR